MRKQVWKERPELKFRRNFHHFRWLKLPESVTYQDPPSIECWNRRQIERKRSQVAVLGKYLGRTKDLLLEISVWTARRALNLLGYYYLVARKKRLLSAKDMVLRSRFAKQMARTKPYSFWTRDVCFYLDGVSFVHKYNPNSESCAPGCCVWQKKNEGLTAGLSLIHIWRCRRS